MASSNSRGLISELLRALGAHGAATHPHLNAGSDVSPYALAKLWWLTDVPAFIDGRLVDRLYNAIVRPEFILIQSSEKAARMRSETSTNELETLGGVSIPAFLKIEARARATAASMEALTDEKQITKQYVHSSERRLQEIVSTYVRSHRERLLLYERRRPRLTTFLGQKRSWNQAEELLDEPGPRPLLFIDLPPHVPILPHSAESQSGKPVVLIDTVVENLQKLGRAVPAYPKNNDPDEVAKSLQYWDALIREYENWAATEAINTGFGAGERIEWIDFRVKLSSRERPAHLHFAPAGTAPTGDFAYHLVRRGFKVGLRLVGQLKKGGYLDVLAHYQR